MKVFSPIDEGIAITRSGGVYKQVPLFTYDGRVFAKDGGGFIGLNKHNNSTTKATVQWVSVSIETPKYDSIGRMLFDAGE